MPLKSLSPDPRPPRPPASEEAAAWRDIVGTWKPLHGSIFGGGLSVEWHDFRLEKDIDWSRSFHKHSLEVCLNFSGSAMLDDGSGQQALGVNQMALYTTPGRRMQATRKAGSLHRFLTVELSPEFLNSPSSSTPSASLGGSAMTGASPAGLGAVRWVLMGCVAVLTVLHLSRVD